MRIVRGRKKDVESDATATADLLHRAAEEQREFLRVWRPPRHVAFGKRDTTATEYEAARDAALVRGYQPREREVGGRAVAYTGNTVAITWAKHTETPRSGIEKHYTQMISWLQNSLERLGVSAVEGEPDRSWCPGSHSLMIDKKIAGIAQRIGSASKLISALLIVRDDRQIAEVLEPIYTYLDMPFDPTTVGSIQNALGGIDPDSVIDAIIAEIPGRRHDMEYVI